MGRRAGMTATSGLHLLYSVERKICATSQGVVTVGRLATTDRGGTTETPGELVLRMQ